MIPLSLVFSMFEAGIRDAAMILSGSAFLVLRVGQGENLIAVNGGPWIFRKSASSSAFFKAGGIALDP
jgi:hypothetical protein